VDHSELTISTAATAATAKIIAMTTLQKAVVAATLILLAGAGIYETRQTSRLRDQVETLQQQQAPLLEQIAALNTENARLSNQVARLREANVLSPAQRSELLKLRGQTTAAQTDAREIARLKAALTLQKGKMPDYLINQMALSMYFGQKREKKNALTQLARTKERLHLTDEQALTLSNIMMLRVEREHQLEFDMATHDATSNRLAEAARTIDQQESELKALLTPEQLAAYPEYLQQENAFNADNSARADAGRLAEDFQLSADQQEKLRARLYEINLNKPPDPLDLRGIIQAGRTSQPAEALQAALELKRSQLEDNLKVLGDILTQEQIQAYREERLQILNMEAVETRLMMPQPAAGTQ
jgi:hypothetical protein